jgi:transglutaminase-like putative cysteine protease
VFSKSILSIILITFLVLSFSGQENLVIKRIIPEMPFFGESINVFGDGFLENDNKIYINNTPVNQDFFNLNSVTSNEIKINLLDTLEENNLIVSGNNGAVMQKFRVKSNAKIEYFNPVSYTLVYEIKIRNIRAPDPKDMVYIHIPQPVLSNGLTVFTSVSVDPKPLSKQDNGVLVYSLDANTKEFIFKQELQVTTRYEKVTADNTADLVAYDTDMEYYKYYTRTENPFIIPEHVSIKKLLVRILDDKNSVLSNYGKAQKIYQYVTSRMVHKYPPDNRSPLYSMEKGEGDCLSDNYLFATLIRSAGIPVRLNSGYILYHTYKVGGFHFWADVFIPGMGWVPYDLSFGHNQSFLKAHKYETDAAFYSGGTDGRRIAFCIGRVRLMLPDENGNWAFYKYLDYFQNPVATSFKTKKIFYDYNVNASLKIKDISSLYNEEDDWFKKEK